jgi:hypothetical protein
LGLLYGGQTVVSRKLDHIPVSISEDHWIVFTERVLHNRLTFIE